MHVLIDHGAWYNFGDVAMLEAAVSRFSRATTNRYSVVSRPALDSAMFSAIWRHPGVLPVKPFLLHPLFFRMPLAWRRGDRARQVFLACDLVALGRLSRASDLRLYGTGETLGAWCEPFDAL